MKVIGAGTLPLGTGAPGPRLCGSALMADLGLELRQREDATGIRIIVHCGHLPAGVTHWDSRDSGSAVQSAGTSSET